MSIIEPKIDVLLNETDNDRFLLCALASKRAHDINDMMRGQRDRAIQLQTAVEIARAADKKPLSLAFNEIAPRTFLPYLYLTYTTKRMSTSICRHPLFRLSLLLLQSSYLSACFCHS